MRRFLKPLRVLAALAFFAAVSAAFLQPIVVAALCLEAAPDWSWAAKIQFLPALFALNVPVVIALLAVTVLFGRVYCSTVCPLGVLQDMVGWWVRLLQCRRRGRSAVRGAGATLSRSSLRWWIMAAVAGAPFVGGLTALLAILDPYSAFGRFATALGRPVLQLAVNVGAAWGEAHDQYWLIAGDVVWPTAAALAVATLSLLAIVILAAWKGRWYCNHICPVGSCLALVSRTSVFKLKINAETCVGCGLCARLCKAEAIDIAAKTIDNARCVRCFNCLGTCPKGAIGR